ncbi:Rieske (2Fe-2S) protein [Fictibacillus sp. WQ 8-8]|uniref:Rieske (2Fe-2S) protein n=1 Tax=Fictibacillus sp. WQ 8-8 TaxID=2938788 RepID=UPI00210C7F5D|nr:Rieske (2Fe-2S) protein [Fictibacillus sp. WQ 8-8]MCQ6268104.1 Rieske (2Fe-2S) protein [Fictibacillus sp. WQ 8-8]
MSAHVVASIDEVGVGQSKMVEVEGRSISVFNVNGEFYALRNVCPHQGAPVCSGSVGGMTVCREKETGNWGEVEFIKKGEILRCPWHGWEFDIKTGKSIFDPNGCLVKTYKVTVGVLESEMALSQLETYPVTIHKNSIIVHA